MTKNRICYVLIALIVLVASLNTTYAVSIFDSKTTDSVYKVSEDDSTFDLPFYRAATERIDIDTSISQIGMFLSQSSIEVNAPLEGVQLYYSTDTVRLNADTEYSVILSTGNVVIDATVEKSTIIYCTGTITITENANIKDNLICYASELTVNGDIDGNLLGYASTLNLNSSVLGQVRMSVDYLNCSDTAVVENGINISTANESLTVAESVGEANIEVTESASFSDYVMAVIVAVLADVVMYLLLVIFAKKDNMSKMADKLQNSNKIIKSGLISFLGLLFITCIGIVLLAVVSDLGIACLVFAIGIMIIITLLKNVIFVALIAQLATQKYSGSNVKVSSLLTAIVSFIMLEVLAYVPYLGEIIKFITFILALGIVTTLISSVIKPDGTNTKKDDSSNDDTHEVIEAK